MPIETTVTVTASVAQNASNSVAHMATSTVDVGFWQEIINWFLSLI